VSSLPKAVTWKWTGRDSNPRPLGSRASLGSLANALLLSHTGHGSGVIRNYYNAALEMHLEQKGDAEIGIAFSVANKIKTVFSRKWGVCP